MCLCAESRSLSSQLSPVGKGKMQTISISCVIAIVLGGLANALGQPLIITQPQNQTNAVGTTATFSVEATGTPPLIYQWRAYASGTSFTNIPGATNNTLILSNVQTSTANFRYAVAVSDAAGSVTSILARVTVLAPPTITSQPQGPAYAVSLGVTVTFQVAATGAAPLSHQWRLNEQALTGKTNFSLTVSNVQTTDAGSYSVLVTNVSGSVTSLVATLIVDPTFTKVTTGPVVTDGGSSGGGAWADYDGDGFLDLFVSNGTAGGALGKNFLYHNNANGTFTRVTTGMIVTEDTDSHGGAWGDYDNDGYPDLFVPSYRFRYDLLYRNNGDGSFTKITSGPVVTSGQFASGGAAWADFDNDGFLDLYVPTFNDSPTVNRFFRNNGDGTFSRITNSPAVSESGDWAVAGWADYDNDGQMDLFVCRYFNANNALYRNTGHGSFTRISAGSIVNDGGSSIGCGWADYDNDGFFDLFVANGGPSSADASFNFLYHNNGDGTFTKNTSDITARDLGSWATCAWGDYDNDGFIDLFVANQITRNALYHNNGDGTFTKITTGSLANEGNSFGCSWADYDNDGFLDLFVANGSGGSAQNNFLYRNNGNSNASLKVKLEGTQSNRSGIGAKVRVTTNIRGNSVRQLRQISGGAGGQSTLLAHFGLGDATNVDTVRIEWPSGTVQEFHDLAVKQLLTVTEPPRLQLTAKEPGGYVRFTLRGGTGFTYVLETSEDLATWLPLRTNTATGLTLEFEDTDAANFSLRFYRTVLSTP